MAAFIAQWILIFSGGVTIVVTLTALASKYLEGSRSKWMVSWIRSDVAKALLYTTFEEWWQERREKHEKHRDD